MISEPFYTEFSSFVCFWRGSLLHEMKIFGSAMSD